MQKIHKNNPTLLPLILLLTISTIHCTKLDDISTKLTKGISTASYSLHSSDTHQTMDCLKICEDHDTNYNQFGIFHTGNSQTHFSELFYAQRDPSTGQWKNTVKLSDRGSQGYVKRVYINGRPSGYLVGFELENPTGNKIAIRYY